uniref:Tautomerase cis-CaaD-like domain-containing protein n=1 Tax=Mycena chlorophos TaxID=658473 RepID=A0ABQ0L337_MYCCL|nr:predicted protein [Mycena chlorophos]
MPIHRWLIPKGLYTPADKAALAEAIADLYERRGLPRFYVVVVFVDQEEEGFYYGGKPVGAKAKQFVRVDVEHIARNFASDATTTEKHRWMDGYEAVVAPWTKDRGVHWEVQVKDVCDRDLWHQDGMVPPPLGSLEQKIWKRENRPVPPEEMEAMKRASEEGASV